MNFSNSIVKLQVDKYKLSPLLTSQKTNTVLYLSFFRKYAFLLGKHTELENWVSSLELKLPVPQLPDADHVFLLDFAIGVLVGPDAVHLVDVDDGTFGGAIGAVEFALDALGEQFVGEVLLLDYFLADGDQGLALVEDGEEDARGLLLGGLVLGHPLDVVDELPLLGEVLVQELALELLGLGAVDADEVDEVHAVGLASGEELLVHGGAARDEDVVLLALLGAEDEPDHLEALLDHLLLVLLGGEHLDQVQEGAVVEVVGDVLAVVQQDVDVPVVDLLVVLDALHQAVQVPALQHQLHVRLLGEDAQHYLVNVHLDLLVLVHRQHDIRQHRQQVRL